MPTYKLIYFPAAARAEVPRLCFTIGKVEFEDKRVTFPDLQALKPSLPFGQLPVLEVDGKVLAQSAAISRYVAKITGLMPEDPWEVALADQACGLIDDTSALIYGTMRIKDQDEKIKAREELLVGSLKNRLLQLSKLVEGNEFVAGSQLSYGDLTIFTALCYLSSGVLDGIPTTLLNDYPVLMEFRTRIASIPAIKEYYEKADDSRKAYRP